MDPFFERLQIYSKYGKDRMPGHNKYITGRGYILTGFLSLPALVTRSKNPFLCRIQTGILVKVIQTTH